MQQREKANGMTVEQARGRRERLRKRILDEIQDYEELTGAIVRSVFLEKVEPIGSATPVTVNVDLDIAI